DERAVSRLRQVKGQHHRPFSVIAPSLEWIHRNCVVSRDALDWLSRLPGPYTLILPLRNPDAVAWNVNMGVDTLGVRLPDCWIKDVVRDLEVPLVTTSANPVGGDVMVDLRDMHPQIRSGVDFVIYDGAVRGVPSTLVYLEGGLVRVEERQ
ncbi:MAG: Sua5/YciO/YrdC/YwlC family protein, partial [Nitrosarchaeum sp.]|nr:Sua5/YciO/YrdC/YwlC family protein [Nitrosarchaeum sp.]